MAYIPILGLLALLAPKVGAQTELHEVIYGAFLYTLYGDRTPYVLPDPTLTPLGAQQLYTAGAGFRNRYVNPITSSDGISTAVAGISPYNIDNSQLSILSYADSAFVASAQAFMQGLYPPVQSTSNYSFQSGESELANGSNVDFPLDGYQYSQLYTASDVDLNSIWVAGNLNCPEYTASRSEYFASDEYEQLLEDSQSFYQELQANVLDGIFPNSSIGYFDAYYIWDYLNYGYIHNDTVASAMSAEQLARARNLADQWIFATNGDLSASGSEKGDHIRAIGGRALASELARAMYTNINTEGEDNKMVMLFGSYEPMVAFTSLAGLATTQNAQFFGQPNLGSSMVFELYALQSNMSNQYPDIDDLMIRFLFQNGSGSDLVAYPLFGNGPSEIGISFNEFMTGLENFMILSIEDWCETCNSDNVFCPAFEEGSGSGIPSPSPSDGGSSIRSTSGMKPAVAGVIGAIITLVLVALIAGLAMALLGIRVYRMKTKRRSELNGFKGGEKLASDQDLSITKSVVGASVVPSGSEPPKGHERIGSWEMGPGNPKETQQTVPPAAKRPSFEDDDIHVTAFSQPVKPNDRV